MGRARMFKGQSGRARFESYSPAHPSPAGSSGGAERRGAELLSSRRAADTMNAAKNAVHEAGLAHASRGGSTPGGRDARRQCVWMQRGHRERQLDALPQPSG